MSEATRFAEALAEQFTAALTAMRNADAAATVEMVQRVERGEAKLMIVCELIPEFSLKLIYCGPDGQSADVYRLTAAGHGETLQ